MRRRVAIGLLSVVASLAILALSPAASAQNDRPSGRENVGPNDPTSGARPTIYIAGDSTAANGIDGARGWQIAVEADLPFIDLYECVVEGLAALSEVPLSDYLKVRESDAIWRRSN